jgi:CheY-like chemotaxis protein
VLLVEDHPLNRKWCRDLLSQRFEVIEAESAEAALASLRTCTPDLILTDIQLPGMDGLTLTRQLKADPATTGLPIVALSALTLRQDVEEAFAAGCLAFVTKPITDDPLTFLERVAAWMRSVSP